MFKDLVYPICKFKGSKNPTAINYYAFELVKDKNGLTDTRPEYRDYYKNLNDAKLKNIAPKNMYTATTLGLNSLVFNQTVTTYLNFTYDRDSHQGPW